MTAPFWIGERLEKLRREYPTANLDDLAAEFGVSPIAMRRAAENRGFKRDKETTRASRSAVAKASAERRVSVMRAKAAARALERAVTAHPFQTVVRAWVGVSANA